MYNFNQLLFRCAWCCGKHNRCVRNHNSGNQQTGNSMGGVGGWGGKIVEETSTGMEEASGS